MFFKWRNSAYCINLDWLQYTVLTAEEDPLLSCPDGYRLEVMQGNNIFRNRAFLIDGQGRKVLTLLWLPYSRVLNSRLMSVQVANEFLYSRDIVRSFELVQSIVSCVFNSIGRFDLCIDFEMNQRIMSNLKHLNSGHLYVQRKKEGSVWWHDGERNEHFRKLLHCLSWGSKASEIKVKIYDKSREQGTSNGQEPEKPWIVDEWRNNNLDIANMWRLEFSLSGAGELQYNDEKISLEMLQNEEWCISVLIDLYMTRFVTRVNQGKRGGHKTGDKRVYILDLPREGEHLSWKEIADVNHVPINAVVLLRSLMRGLDNPATMCNRHVFMSYANTITSVVHMHQMERYFEQMFGSKVESYLAELSESAGGGIRQRIAPPSMVMD